MFNCRAHTSINSVLRIVKGSSYRSGCPFVGRLTSMPRMSADLILGMLYPEVFKCRRSSLLKKGYEENLKTEFR